jgi:hypothetical protein
MQVGDQVRVNSPTIIYVHPEHKGQPFDIKDMEGEIMAIVTEWRGRPVSANFPYLVQFDQKFKVHLKAEELEKIS